MTAVEYLEESGVPESRWGNFRDWVGWFDRKGLMGVVRRKEDNEICGVALARCLPSGAAPSHYWHEESGDDVFVDLTVCGLADPSGGAISDREHGSRSKDYLKSLLIILLDRFGRRRTISFRRNGSNPRTYDYEKFMRKALS